MATSSHQLTDISAGLATVLLAHVGVATWRIILTPEAAAAIGRDASELGAPFLNEEAIERVMVSVRDKALRLNWYGGGTMTIDANELSLDPTPEPRDADGREVPKRCWYRIEERSLVAGAPSHLRVVP